MALDAFICAANDQLAAESGRISEMVNSKAIIGSPWLSLVRKAQFPSGMGQTLQTLIYQRTTVPDVTNAAWSNVGFNDGDPNSNTCNPTTQQIQYAYSYKSYNLQQMAVKSPVLCINDIRYGWQFGEQLAEQTRILTENTKWIWENRYRDEYLRLAGNHIVLDSLNPYETSTTGSEQDFPAVEPVTPLQQGFLDAYYLQLARDSADGYYGMVEGAKQFLLISSPETINNLKKQNSDIRQDLRFSDEANTLLAPLGARWSYMNYAYIADLQNPRYKFEGGEFVRIPFYINQAATSGTQSVVNPEYNAAPYEVSFIWNPEVFTSRVASAITNPGGGTSFNPVNYLGDFVWRNILDNECNILGNQGYFYSLSMQGSQPKRTEWGYAIMHQRCGSPNYNVVCQS